MTFAYTNLSSPQSPNQLGVVQGHRSIPLGSPALSSPGAVHSTAGIMAVPPMYPAADGAMMPNTYPSMGALGPAEYMAGTGINPYAPYPQQQPQFAPMPLPAPAPAPMPPPKPIVPSAFDRSFAEVVRALHRTEPHSRALLGLIRVTAKYPEMAETGAAVDAWANDVLEGPMPLSTTIQRAPSPKGRPGPGLNPKGRPAGPGTAQGVIPSVGRGGHFAPPSYQGEG